MNARPPAPPTHEDERKLGRLVRWAFSDDLWARPQAPPPGEWGAQAFGVPRKTAGVLAGLLFPREDARGVIVLGHPAVSEGKAFFHQNNRLPFVRNLGFACVTFDHGGFGESDGPTGLYHSEWEDMIGWARRRFPDLPVHLWGVGVSGYFAHHALSRDPGLGAAVFEHVAPDLASQRRSMRLARLAMRWRAPRALDWLSAVAHAPFIHVERALYLYGTADPGLPPAEAERLARAAGPLATKRAIDGAGALDVWTKGGADFREALRKTLEA